MEKLFLVALITEKIEGNNIQSPKICFILAEIKHSNGSYDRGDF